MKQKYTITVADMQLNIISDASPDEVENIVGMLDRRMRDFNLKSPRCTKNEAAILCALSYCSERIAMQEAFKKVEKDAFRYAGENEKLKKTIEVLQEELDTLRKDASVMRSILDRATISATPASDARSDEKAKYVPKPFKVTEEAEQATVSNDVAESVPAPEQPSAPVVEKPTVEIDNSKKGTKKNHMGSMFDFLTFGDV